MFISTFSNYYPLNKTTKNLQSFSLAFKVSLICFPPYKIDSNEDIKFVNILCPKIQWIISNIKLKRRSTFITSYFFVLTESKTEFTWRRNEFLFKYYLKWQNWALTCMKIFFSLEWLDNQINSYLIKKLFTLYFWM